MSGTAPTYRYDPNLGNARDAYTRAAIAHPGAGQPEVPGRFVASVDGETIINTMHGPRTVAWRVEPGAPCVILGYWADGTIHLRWAAIGGHYQVDGRFPSWVAEPDPDAQMAGGGRILRANNPVAAAVQGMPIGALLLLALLVVAVVLLVIVTQAGR